MTVRPYIKRKKMTMQQIEQNHISIIHTKLAWLRRKHTWFCRNNRSAGGWR